VLPKPSGPQFAATLVLLEKHGKKSISLHHALDTYHVAIDPEQDDIATDHGQPCIFANVGPQLVQHRPSTDAIDFCSYLSNEGHSAARVVGAM
jgi:hypothetical protein